MKSNRILSFILCAVLMLTMVATLSVATVFAEDAATETTPALPATGSTLTIPEFNKIAAAQENKGSATTEKYVVSGTITEIKNDTYGNMYIKDADGESLYIYGIYCNDGNIRFDAMNPQPKVGDSITVSGPACNYNGAQMKNSWILKLNGADYVYVEPETEAPAPAPEYDAELSFADKANRTELTTEKQVWTMNDITVINDKGDSQSNVADYVAPARFYQTSNLTINCDNMIQVDIYCNSDSYAKSLAETGINAGTATADGKVVTVKFDDAVDSLVFTALQKQVRVDSIGIIVDTPDAPAIDPEDGVYNDLGEKYYILNPENEYEALYEITIDKKAGTLTANKDVYKWTYTTEGGFKFENEQVNLTFNPRANAYMLQIPGLPMVQVLVTEVPEEPVMDPLFFGENNVAANGAGIAYTFTAKAAGTYVFNWGKIEGVALIETEFGSEDISFPYEVKLGERESFTIILATADWSDGKVDVIISGEDTVAENVLTFGDNNVAANGAGIAYTFTAKTAGTYVFNWGKIEGIALIETEFGSEDISFPYEIKLGERESFTIILATADWSDGKVDLVINIPEEPKLPVIELGENKINVPDNGKVISEFYSKANGVYTFSWAKGETNGYIVIEKDNVTYTPELPFLLELKKGESVKVIVMTHDGAADEVNLVVSAGIPEAQTGTLTYGENKVNATFTGTAYTFYSKGAGTYVFNWGENAGVALLENANGISEINFPFEINLGVRDQITIVLSSDNSTPVDVIISGIEPEVGKLILGNNSVAASKAGIAYTFTADADATYVFTWTVMEGIAVVDGETVEFPYSVTLKKGQTIEIALASETSTDVDVTVTALDIGGDIFADDDGAGCYGVIGSGSLIAILALVPAAYALRRKEDQE